MDPNIADWLSQYRRANEAEDTEKMMELKAKIEERQAKLVESEGHCGIDESHLRPDS